MGLVPYRLKPFFLSGELLSQTDFYHRNEMHTKPKVFCCLTVCHVF
jgi:hypothetical protein